MRRFFAVVAGVCIWLGVWVAIDSGEKEVLPTPIPVAMEQTDQRFQVISKHYLEEVYHIWLVQDTQTLNCYLVTFVGSVHLTATSASACWPYPVVDPIVEKEK